MYLQHQYYRLYSDFVQTNTIKQGYTQSSYHSSVPTLLNYKTMEQVSHHLSRVVDHHELQVEDFTAAMKQSSTKT